MKENTTCILVYLRVSRCIFSTFWCILFEIWPKNCTKKSTMVENIVRYVRILMYWTTHDVVSGTVLLLFSVGKYIFSGRVTYIERANLYWFALFCCLIHLYPGFPPHKAQAIAALLVLSCLASDSPGDSACLANHASIKSS